MGVASNGKEAIRRRRPDLLILGISMPEISGSQVLDLARRDPGFYDMPVLMLTGQRGQTKEDFAVKAGATEYSRKPFDPDQLLVLLDSLLAKARRHDAAP